MIKVNGNKVIFEKFPNGETRMVVDNINSNIDNEVDFKYEDDGDLIKLMFVKNYIDSKNTHSYSSLNIYYMPYSRQDRVEGNSAFTLKYITKFINGLGFNKVTVIEPHSNVTPALLDNVESKFINLKLLEKVTEHIDFYHLLDYLVFPDEGASKRYGELHGFNVLVGHKIRDFSSGEILSLDLIGDNNKAGTKALIVDDLSSYGGTFVATAKELKSKFGIEEVYLLVAHAENSIFKGKLFEHVDKVFTTNSILTEQDNWENQKFKNQLHVFNIEELIQTYSVEDKVRIIDNIGCHGFKIGDVVKIIDLIFTESEKYYIAVNNDNDAWCVGDEEIELV